VDESSAPLGRRDDTVIDQSAPGVVDSVRGVAVQPIELHGRFVARTLSR
jgi:hypothetical protein